MIDHHPGFPVADWTETLKAVILSTPQNEQKNHHQAPIAQLDRVPPSEGGGRTFESCWARQSIWESVAEMN